MKPEDILARPAVRLDEAERRRFFADGFLGLPGAISAAWADRLRVAMQEMIEASRGEERSGPVFELEEGHCRARPRLHRLYSPQDHHPVFWEFITSDEMTALAADVVGPDVKFHHAKLNFKSALGSRGFKWHQDIQAWPHTDYSPVTIGVYIDGCGPEQGPLAVVPGSHLGPLYSMYDATGNFVVRIAEDQLGALDTASPAAPVGPPGTALLLSCRAVHGSVTNTSERSRPMLLVVYSSADSFPYTASPIPSPRLGEIVRGSAARFASFDPRPCELPPDWARQGYAGPWRAQRAEERRAAR